MGNSSNRHGNHYHSNLYPRQSGIVNAGHGLKVKQDTNDHETDERKGWDSVYDGDVDAWNQIANMYCLSDVPAVCTTSQVCDRDYLCHGHCSIFYNRRKKVLDIIRYRKLSCQISIATQPYAVMLMSSSVQTNLPVVAMSRHLVVLEVNAGVKKVAFPVLDLNQRCIAAIYEPDSFVTLIEGEISPDLSCTGLLLHGTSQEASSFSFDIFLICNTTGVLISRVPLGSLDVQPHIAFHPLYNWSHVVTTRYSNGGGKLALLDLNDQTDICKFSIDLQLYSQLFASFSIDGRFLFLQNINDDRFGITSYCDTFVFKVTDKDIQLCKFISIKIPSLFYSCRVWFRPVFSTCGQYVRFSKSDKSVKSVKVYRLPSEVKLRDRCRQVILSCLVSRSVADLYSLPLPNSLIKFLEFSPIFDT